MSAWGGSGVGRETRILPYPRERIQILIIVSIKIKKNGIHMSKKEIADTNKKLGEALKEDKDEIEISAEIEGIVIKIKGTGNIAWGICIGAIALLVVGLVMAPATGGTSAAALIPTGGAVVRILGSSTAAAAVSIAYAAGGAGQLNKLRKYKIIHRNERIFLIKK